MAHEPHHGPRPNPLAGSPGQARARRHVIYAFVVSVVAVAAGYQGVLPVFRSHLMQYLSIGDDRFGLLFSIGSLTGLTSVLTGGHLVDRWGPRRVIRICLVGVGCAMLAIAAAGARYGVFVFAAGLSGLFSAPLFIAINAYLAKLFPRHRRRAISLNLASTSMGGMMFPLVAEGLLRLARLSNGIAFRQVLHPPFLLFGAILFAAAGIYRRPAGNRARPVTHGRKRRPLRHGRDPLPRPRALLLAFLIASHGVADGTLHLWMPRFLESGSFAQAAVPPGIVLSGYSLAYLLARFLLASLPDRMGRRALVVVPGLAGGTLLIAGIASRSFLLTAGGYVLGAFCWSVEYPAMVAMLMREAKQKFGVSMAVSSVMTGLMFFVWQTLMGLFVHRAGDAQMWKPMLLAACGFPLVGIGGLLWLVWFDRPPGSRGARR